MLPRPKLAHDRAEDAGADRLLVLVDEDGGVGIEPDHRPVGTANVLGGADDHRMVNVALLDAAARRRFLHGNDDDVADARGPALRPAQHLDALDALRAAVVRDVQIGLHLDHCSTLILSKSSLRRPLPRALRPWPSSPWPPAWAPWLWPEPSSWSFT